MDAIVLTRDEYSELLNRLNAIQKQFTEFAKDPQDTILDNADFLRLMKVSRRTAATWREEGIISYSQVSNKIFYRMSDIAAMLNKFHNKTYK